MPYPSRSPRPTDPGPPGPSDPLWSEYERGYADGRIAGLRSCPQHHLCPPPQKPCADSESLFMRFLVGLFLGLVLGLLIGIFLGLFIGQSGG